MPLLYEHLTAHHIGKDPGSPEHGMYREGLAMRDAFAADLAAATGQAVRFLSKTDLAISHGSEPLFIIAPETDGCLRDLIVRARAAGNNVIAPSVEAVELTSDKLALAEHWQRHGVRTPETRRLADWPRERVPAVVKPRDGAGSEETYRVDQPFEASRLSEASRLRKRAESVLETTIDSARLRRRLANGWLPFLAQDYIPGRPASVAFLVGPAQTIALQPTFQLLSDDGCFQYFGGELPIPAELAERAVKRAAKAIACVPGLLGYVGVDLVLGDASDGSKDHAIEINPRLTTSYVGLRALSKFNLAGLLWHVCDGYDVLPPEWHSGPVRFTADGVVETAT